MDTPEHYYTGRHLLQPFYVSIVSSSYFSKTNQEASLCLDAGSSWLVRSYPIRAGRCLKPIGEAGAPSGYLKVLYHALSILLIILINYDELFKMTAQAGHYIEFMYRTNLVSFLCIRPV